MEIEFYQTKNYGATVCYVVNKEQAEAIHVITGQKTLTLTVREGLEQLGITFKEVLPPKYC